jgi:hypothetical protein
MLRKLALAAALSLIAGAAPAGEFRFVALGDMPYGEPAAVYGAYQALIDAVNRRGPDIVLHIGDTKSGSTPCSDETLDDQLAFLMSYAAAVIYTPGDNEWTDCHRPAAGGYDPVERLAYIRATYFADPATSFGEAPIALAHQGARGYPENSRAIHKGVAFIAAHVVGSNNNFETRDPAAVEEFLARNAATTDWLAESFAAAAQAQAAVVAIHADMFQGGFNLWGQEGWPSHSGFAAFGPALQKAAAAFGKPVLLVFGDSHEFRVFRPFPKSAPNVTALEVFGARDMHAVEVRVDTATRGVFSIAPLLNPAL